MSTECSHRSILKELFASCKECEIKEKRKIDASAYFDPDILIQEWFRI
jgi:hypothetical protein